MDKTSPARFKLIAVLNLAVSSFLLVYITYLTHTEFILPPFLATATTKFPDPAWRFHRSVTIITSYVLAAIISVLFSSFHTLFLQSSHP